MRILAIILSWALYTIGDLVSKLLMWWYFAYVFYPVYNKLMGWSVAIQDRFEDQSHFPWE